LPLSSLQYLRRDELNLLLIHSRWQFQRAFLAILILAGAVPAMAQSPTNAPAVPAASANTPMGSSPSQVSSSSYQGSVVTEKVQPGVLPLSIHDAMERGLKYNLGYVLQSQSALSAGGQKLQELQPLLPTIQGGATNLSCADESCSRGIAHPWVSSSDRAVWDDGFSGIAGDGAV
jgi:hypothetical protein